MQLFTSANLAVFDDERAADPAYDAERVHVRDKLVALHTEIYPEMRQRRWDLHPYASCSMPYITRQIPSVNEMILAYGKAETVRRLMKKELDGELNREEAQARLAVRVDAQGTAIELFVGAPAWGDGKNFKHKLLQGAPQKQHLRQLLAELGSAYVFVLNEAGLQPADSLARREVLHARCSRLVNLGVLNAALALYKPGQHDLVVTIRYREDDARWATETAAAEILFRLGQLYPLYQFVSWSPRNDYVQHPRSQESELTR